MLGVCVVVSSRVLLVVGLDTSVLCDGIPEWRRPYVSHSERKEILKRQSEVLCC